MNISDLQKVIEFIWKPSHICDIQQSKKCPSPKKNRNEDKFMRWHDKCLYYKHEYTYLYVYTMKCMFYHSCGVTLKQPNGWIVRKRCEKSIMFQTLIRRILQSSSNRLKSIWISCSLVMVRTNLGWKREHKSVSVRENSSAQIVGRIWMVYIYVCARVRASK